MSHARFQSWATAILVVGCGWLVASANGDERAVYRSALRNLLADDPLLSVPGIENAISDGQRKLWIEALDSSEAGLRCQAADSITTAKRLGLGEWSEAVPKLESALKDKNVAVRRAASRALIELDSRPSAPLLAEQSDRLGLAAAEFIEPVLARWDYQPRREVWLKRLSDPQYATERALWAQCLATVREAKAVESLRLLVMDQTVPPQLRLQAAHAMGQIQRSGLSEDARRLVSLKDVVPRSSNRLLAASLLRWHEDPPAVELLQQLAQDEQPTVAAVGLTRLLEIDPKLAYGAAETAIKSRDVLVRRLGVRVLVAKGDLEAIALLATLLGDVNLELRQSVRETLTKFAGEESFRAPIIAHGERWLAEQEHWRAIEQATLMLTNLDHKPCGPRLVELLRHARYEVYVAAAWGIARLQNPDTFEPALAFATERSDLVLGPDAAQVEAEILDYFEQLGHLFEGFGKAKYAPSVPLLRRYIPKNPIASTARGGAIWALGHLFEQGDAELEAQLAARLADALTPNPETPYVRQASAISLGRMKSKSQVSTLERFSKMDGPHSLVGAACFWALTQITGTQFDPVPPVRRDASGWFLQPAP